MNEPIPLSTFIDLPEQQRSQILAEKIGAQCEATTIEHLYWLHLNPNFILNIVQCLLFFPTENVSAADIRRFLQQNDLTAFHITLIITPYLSQQIALCADKTEMSVVPNRAELAAWLTEYEASDVVTQLFASQLKRDLISPYIVAGAVPKNTLFFGREQILTKIISRKPQNYFLVGGRQLGKSSLLQYLVRYYQYEKQVSCHYLSLSSQHLLPLLAHELSLSLESNLTDFIAYFHRKTSKSHNYLFLIDEADLFMQHERQQQFAVLQALQLLSQKGYAYFIFAGFWQVHSAFNEMQATIKNFAEYIPVAELEIDACCALITRPMQKLGIRYRSDKLVQHIVTVTGQRANLVSIICHTMLKNLAANQVVLDKPLLKQTLQSEAVQSQLHGWLQLNAQTMPIRLAKIIIFLTYKKAKFNKLYLQHALNQWQCDYTQEQLQQALAYLRLIFILKSQNNQHCYRVPLFYDFLQTLDVEAELIEIGLTPLPEPISAEKRVKENYFLASIVGVFVIALFSVLVWFGEVSVNIVSEVAVKVAVSDKEWELEEDKTQTIQLPFGRNTLKFHNKVHLIDKTIFFNNFYFYQSFRGRSFSVKQQMLACQRSMSTEFTCATQLVTAD